MLSVWQRRSTKKGGVAILVRQNLPHSLLSSFRTKLLECICISVSSPTSLIHFTSTYRPGGRSRVSCLCVGRSLSGSIEVLEDLKGFVWKLLHQNIACIEKKMEKIMMIFIIGLLIHHFSNKFSGILCVCVLWFSFIFNEKTTQDFDMCLSSKNLKTNNDVIKVNRSDNHTLKIKYFMKI
jgi:hypothetical protein